MFTAKYLAGITLITSLLLSCGKDKDYNVKGDSQVKFFTNVTNTGNAPVNSMSYGVVNIPGTGTGLTNLSTTLPATVKIPVFATAPVSEDVTIGASLDNSLIAKYNESRGTSYEAFPANVLNTSNLTAKILKGSSTSSDSISIPVDLSTVNTLSSKAYIAPIRLTTVSNNQAGTITTNLESQVIYVVADMELRRIKYLATTADIIGSLISSRTNWTASFSPAPTTSGSIFDGSTTTYTRWSSSPAQLDVNMQDTKNVTGIRLYTTNSATLIPTQITVSLSNDGINYDVIGSPLRANLTYASSYNYILFYRPIAAKYIRLGLTYSTSTNTQNFRVTEFDVYAN